jgi:hypothetical protein
MGQLAGIPPDVDLCQLGLTQAGLRFARALQDYGAYVVDSSGGMAFFAEPAVEDGGDASLLADLRGDLPALVSHLRCVTNNASGNPGGGGTRRAPPAPPEP